VTSVAAYLVDIDGTAMLRLAGSEEFPDRIPLALGVGPEIPREGLPPLRAHLAEELPGSVVAPMLLRGRAIGVLLAVDAPEARLAELARQAGAALTLADAYTDVFDDTRRRKETSASARDDRRLLAEQPGVTPTPDSACAGATSATTASPPACWIAGSDRVQRSAAGQAMR
jgi:hypothetical protein